MSPKKKKAAKDKRDRRVKKEKNPKDPPPDEQASFKPDWPSFASSNPLENILRPATRSDTHPDYLNC
jgi:hypothetical protein